MNRLTTHTDIEDARRRITSLLEARAEWFCTERRGGGRSVGLRRGEWELSASPRGLLFSYCGEPGRYARIRLVHEGAHVFATGPVVQLGADGADAFLSSALLWFTRAAER